MRANRYSAARAGQRCRQRNCLAAARAARPLRGSGQRQHFRAAPEDASRGQHLDAPEKPRRAPPARGHVRARASWGPTGRAGAEAFGVSPGRHTRACARVMGSHGRTGKGRAR